MYFSKEAAYLTNQKSSRSYRLNLFLYLINMQCCQKGVARDKYIYHGHHVPTRTQHWTGNPLKYSNL